MSFASTAGPKPMRRPTTTKIAVQTSSQRRFSDQRKGRPASRWVGSWGAVLKAPAVGGVPSSDAVRASTRAPFRRQTCSSADGQFAPSHARSNFLSQHIVRPASKKRPCAWLRMRRLRSQRRVKCHKQAGTDSCGYPRDLPGLPVACEAKRIRLNQLNPRPCDCRTTQSHQSDGSLETQPRAGR
jgi:hypothetical protein